MQQVCKIQNLELHDAAIGLYELSVSYVIIDSDDTNPLTQKAIAPKDFQVSSFYVMLWAVGCFL